MTDASTTHTAVLNMTVGIVANYVSGNKLDPASLPALIQSVHASLTGVGGPIPLPQAPQPERLTAAQIRKLVTPTGIISLINQKPFKSMKRHLTLAGYTPESYRTHFGLPADFPMVHPDYAKARSDMAKAIGLGQAGRKPKAAPAATKSSKPKA